MAKKHPLVGEIISSYTRREAIKDGFLFRAGTENSCEIILTSNLIAALKKEELAQAIVGGMEHAWSDVVRKFCVGDKELLVHYDDDAIIIMLPEDY